MDKGPANRKEKNDDWLLMRVGKINLAFVRKPVDKRAIPDSSATIHSQRMIITFLLPFWPVLCPSFVEQSY
jgi:hypothetical protein